MVLQMFFHYLSEINAKNISEGITGQSENQYYGIKDILSDTPGKLSIISHTISYDWIGENELILSNGHT